MTDIQEDNKVSLASNLIILAIASLGIQDIKVTSHGLSLGARNAPFLYECFIALFILLTIPRLSHKKPIGWFPFGLITAFASLVIISFLRDPSLNLLIGTGSLRMVIWCLCFSLAASFHTFSVTKFKQFVYTFVLVAVINSAYSVLVYAGIIQNSLYPYIPRANMDEDVFRYSGLCYQPGYFGLLVSTGASMSIPFIRSNWKKWLPVFLMLLFGLSLSQSRSGLLGLVAAALIYLILTRNTILILGGSLVLVIIAMSEIIIRLSEVDQILFFLEHGHYQGEATDRISGFLAAFDTIIRNPLGTPWGMSAETPGYGGYVGSPHNLLLQISLWLGLPGLGIFCYVFLTTLHRTAKVFTDFRQLPIPVQSIFSGTVSIIFFGQTEQALNVISGFFPLMLFLVCLSYWNNILARRFIHEGVTAYEQTRFLVPVYTSRSRHKKTDFARSISSS